MRGELRQLRKQKTLHTRAHTSTKTIICVCDSMKRERDTHYVPSHTFIPAKHPNSSMRGSRIASLGAPELLPWELPNSFLGSSRIPSLGAPEFLPLPSPLALQLPLPSPLPSPLPFLGSSRIPSLGVPEFLPWELPNSFLWSSRIPSLGDLCLDLAPTESFKKNNHYH